MAPFIYRTLLIAAGTSLVMLSGCVPTYDLTVTNVAVAQSGICDSQYAGVQKSACLWVGTGEAVGMQWDINACANHDGQPIQFIKQGPGAPLACDVSSAFTNPPPNCSALNACFDGMVLADGRLIATPAWGGTVPATLLACGVDPLNRPHNECQPSTQNIPDAARSCGALPNQNCIGTPSFNDPFCAQGCPRTITRDEVIGLRRNARPDAIVFSPTFYSVSDTRRIDRLMTADSTNSVGGVLAWNYVVAPDPADATGLLENFSPKIFVSKVRAYIEDPSMGSPQYVPIAHLRLDGAPIHCNGSSIDPAEITSDNCTNLRSVNPVYLRGQTTSASPLVWHLSIADGSHGGPSGVSLSSSLRLEFTLANENSTTGNPYLNPAGHEFGVLPSHARVMVPAAMRLVLENSAEEWIVDQATISGPNASEFSVLVHGPRTINAGGTRGVDVSIAAASDGDKFGTAVLTLHDSSRTRTATLTAPLHAYVGAESLILEPEHIDFRGKSHHRILLMNGLTQSFIRQSVTISGGDAAAFSVFNADDTQPVSQSNVIASGQSEIFTINFCPKHYGTSTAQITVKVNEGTPSTPINAMGIVTLTGIAQAPAALCP